jgi:hypothetical protein
MAEGSGMPEGGGAVGGFDSTIALPDSNAAMIQHKVDEIDRQIAQHGAPHGHGGPQQVEYQQLPGGSPMGAPEGYNPNQAAIETKMSLPRPAAVAQWLMEQGDVEIGGPRSTGVIIAIAALATLCVMGVASLIVYKLRLPPADPTSQVSAAGGTSVALLPEEGDEAFAGSYDEKKKKSGSPHPRVATRAPRQTV